LENEIPKVYSPETIEPRWARFWAEQKLYRPSDDASRPRFCLVIPPPNVTGSLHIGHMLEHTEIDTLMRWRRMQGLEVLWLPGTDHASIATQMIVEREMGREALPDLEDGPKARAAWRREGQRRRLEMGREKFLERCWQWKELSGETIRRQMERLGASCDWERERFTMDAEYSRAVTEVFVRLYEEGLIYRGKYIVNWCPRCGTAVSDLEVEHEERPGKLWLIRYPFEDGTGSLTVATTRPETMLGDTAVAVNPNDERFRAAVGRNILLPLLHRVIPVVADDFVDPGFGTGAVKVTPAHDPNDFEIATRHKLPRRVVMDEQGRMTAEAGPYAGLDRYEARQRVLEDLREQNLLEKEEDYTLAAGLCSRCKTVVEPLLSEQWFMKMKPLAGPALRAVAQGRIRIVPENYKKVYLDWINNLHDWCISRQLWWGHRIPAWTCAACGEVMVSRETPLVCSKCGSATLKPEDDVLDTWFSSGLWPFATLGWPKDTEDLRRFYPNDLMIIGYDILFFWGARMIMLGLKFMKDVPFHELYVHALVRDAERQKMSKTKGNVINPLEVTEKYGTDAVRFALAISAAPGTDIAFSYDKVEAYRAFANKIWNAGRFILMNLEKLPVAARKDLAEALDPKERIFAPVAAPETTALADRWIFSRIKTVTDEMEAALGAYRFHEAAYTIYHFFWHEFCDWYVEWVKPEISKVSSSDEPSATWINLLRAFQAALHLLHPFMPFITEELWHRLPRRAGNVSISLAPFALVSISAADSEAERNVQLIRDLIGAARDEKAGKGLQNQRPSAEVRSTHDDVVKIFRAHSETITRLAGLSRINIEEGKMSGRGDELGRVDVSPSGGLFTRFEVRILDLPLADPAVERARLEKEKTKLEQALAQGERQLRSQDFIERAPKEVVAGVERRRAEVAEQLRKVGELLERLLDPASGGGAS
jgi:valyl-tRNA synthetase